MTRSRYRPDPWRLPEWLVLLSGVAAAALAVAVAAATCWRRTRPSTPGRSLTLTHLLVAGLALAGGLAAPVPVRAEATARLPVAVAA